MKRIILALLAVMLCLIPTAAFGAEGENNAVAVEFEKIPVTVYIERENHGIGYRCVPSLNMAVEEKEAGAIGEGMELSFGIENMEFENGYVSNLDGNLEIDVELDEGKFNIEGVTASTEPSVVTVRDMEIYYGKHAYEGSYDVSITLTDVKEGEVLEEKTAEDCFRLYELSDGKELSKPRVTIKAGDSFINSDGRIIELNAPSYISEDGRLMVPLREMANTVFGYTTWDENTKRAVVVNGMRSVGYMAGSNILIINGSGAQAYSEPEIVDGKMFVSVRDFSEMVIGTDSLEWNAETQTAEINPPKQ